MERGRARRQTEIPFYAAWLAAPGAEVPVARRRRPRRRRLGGRRERAEPAGGRAAMTRPRPAAPRSSLL